MFAPLKPFDFSILPFLNHFHEEYFTHYQYCFDLPGGLFILSAF